MIPDASPTARALLALELIQGSPGIGAERLSDKLGVSERAARRYVAILREAGIPIESVRGPYGGYHVGRGLRLPPLMFNPAEALGLVMAVLDGHHEAGDPADPVGSALGKIVRVLPEAVAAQAEAVRRTTAPAPDRGAARPDPETTTLLVQACASSLQVRLGYRSEAGSEWEMHVEPWAVVVRHGRWYLLCRVLSSGATRAFRIDRVRHVEVLHDTFDPPTDLDPVAFLEDHLALGWEYDIEVVIDAPVEAVARCISRAMGRLEPIEPGEPVDPGEPVEPVDPGEPVEPSEPTDPVELSRGPRTRLVGSTSNPRWYAEQLTRLPAAYRVVRCPELRDAVRELGQRALAAAGDA